MSLRASLSTSARPAVRARAVRTARRSGLVCRAAVRFFVCLSGDGNSFGGRRGAPIERRRKRAVFLLRARGHSPSPLALIARAEEGWIPLPACRVVHWAGRRAPEPRREGTKKKRTAVEETKKRRGALHSLTPPLHTPSPLPSRPRSSAAPRPTSRPRPSLTRSLCRCPCRSTR